MTPAEVADSFDAAAKELGSIAHDIRNRRSPGYSDTPVDLTEIETARIKAVAEVLDPAMRQVHGAPPESLPVAAPPAPVAGADKPLGSDVVEPAAVPVAVPVAAPPAAPVVVPDPLDREPVL